MTTNDDHAARIREIRTNLAAICGAVDKGDDTDAQMYEDVTIAVWWINHHVTALEAERDAAEARVQRLQDAYLDVEDDFADIALERTGMTRDEFKAECRHYLHDGDLPTEDAEGTR